MSRFYMAYSTLVAGGLAVSRILKAAMVLAISTPQDLTSTRRRSGTIRGGRG